ncbi:sulfotransferase family protein [Vibrio sp. 1CM2L]|uniref:sulfotransferase family 2 domain-containing protein n=1 Tax=Vibrio sp. 1CM2L TaxID=2929166 RepID=UPI0020BE3D7D|nr:sulfotransferase family protein [Vibrio sp. 1CM2L]
MLISDKKQFLFYHVYKVAGSSIRNNLLPYSNKKQIFNQAIYHSLNVTFGFKAKDPLSKYHPYLKDVRDHLGDKYWKYYKFCFVREPLDWQKSLYFFMKKNNNHFQHKIVKDMTFDDYLYWRLNNDIKFQSDFIFDGDVKLVDDIFKFESLKEDFNLVCNRLNIEYALKHMNMAGNGKAIELRLSTLELFIDKHLEEYKLLGYDIELVRERTVLI